MEEIHSLQRNSLQVSRKPSQHSSNRRHECYNKIVNLSSRKPCLILTYTYKICNKTKMINQFRIYSLQSIIVRYTCNMYLYTYINTYTILYETMIIYHPCDCYFRLVLIHTEARNRCLGTHRRPGVVPRVLTVVAVWNSAQTMNLIEVKSGCLSCSGKQDVIYIYIHMYTYIYIYIYTHISHT